MPGLLLEKTGGILRRPLGPHRNFTKEEAGAPDEKVSLNTLN